MPEYNRKCFADKLFKIVTLNIVALHLHLKLLSVSFFGIFGLFVFACNLVNPVSVQKIIRLEYESIFLSVHPFVSIHSTAVKKGLISRSTLLVTVGSVGRI